MKRHLVICVSLLIAGIGVLAARSFVPPSELARKGVRSLGQVLFKDSRPAGDGFTYTVTFVYPDQTQRNHQVTRVVPNKAFWDTLRQGQEVKVVYMPGTPDEASIQGAEGLARPHDAAYGFLGWSLVVAALVWGFVVMRGAASTDGPESSARR